MKVLFSWLAVFVSFQAVAMPLNSFLKSEGFTPLQGKFAPLPLLNVHEIYTSTDLKSNLYFRFDLPKEVFPVPEGQFLSLGENDSIVYLYDKNKAGYAVIFSNIEEKERAKLVIYIKTHFSKQTPFLETVKNLVLPSANADEKSECLAGVASSITTGTNLNQMRTLTEENEMREIYDISKSCFVGALQGLWDGTGGMVAGFAKGGFDLIFHPVDTFHKIKNDFAKISKFFMTFRASLNKLGSTLAQMPASSKAELLCSFIGMMAGPTILAIFTGGAGAGELAAELSIFLNRISGLQRFLSYFSKLGDLKKVLGERFMSALARGKISSERIESIEAFASHSFPELAKEAALCGI